jgi:hypothetical protein
MLMNRRWVIAMAVVISMAVGGVAVAMTDPTPPVLCGSDDPHCTITVGDPSLGTPSTPGTTTPGGSGAGSCYQPTGPSVPTGLDCLGCKWTQLGASELNAEETALIAKEGGAFYVDRCYNDGGPILCPCSPVHVPDGTTPGTNSKPASDLAATVTFPLPPPKIGTSPGTYAYVGAPTFLYLDAAAWKPVSGSATDGFKTVGAVATPYEVIWDTGDLGGAATVTCTGPGRAYDASKDGSTTPLTELKPPCGYMYSGTSADGQELKAGDPSTRADAVTATVHWKVTWTCVGACDVASGQLADVTSTSSTYRVVYQLESLNCTGVACGGQAPGHGAPPTEPVK